MKKVLLASSGRGKELADLLRLEFGIPPNVKWFEIRFALNEPGRLLASSLQRLWKMSSEH